MDLRAIGLGLAFAFMWSSAFTSARVIVAHAPPLTALTLRYVLSGLIAVAIARAVGARWPRDPAQWRAIAVFGICQNALYLGLNFVAMQTIEASLAAIIASTMPLIVAAAAWAGGERLPPLGLAGLLAGIGGVALIMGTRLEAGADPAAIALCVIAALGLSVATLAVRGASGDSIVMAVGLQMFVGAAALAPFAVALERWEVDPTPALAIAFAYTLFVPGLLATWVWFVLIGRVGPTRAAVFHFLNPFLGVAVAALLLGERLGPLDAVGVAVIAGGIYAVQRSRA